MMEDLVHAIAHHSPSLRVASGSWHGHADRPPFLRLRVGGHLGHVGRVVGAVIFEVGEQQVFRLASERSNSS